MEIQPTSDGQFIIICSDLELKILTGCVGHSSAAQCHKSLEGYTFKEMKDKLPTLDAISEALFDEVYSSLNTAATADKEIKKKKRGRPKKNGT